jgi:UDP-glucose 4-epimerase
MAGKIIITGGAGFIGSALAARLATSGDEIVVIDNLANGERSNLASLPVGQIRLVVADIRDAAAYAAELAGARVVFHLACLGLRHSLHAPAENHAVNATGTLTLLEAARAARVGRFVHVSSSEVYGDARAGPMDEEHPTAPTTVYGAAKLAGEAYARAAFHTHGLAVTVVRPFNAFGPRCHHAGDAGEVIPKFMLRALAGRPLVVFGDGRQTRDFTFVDDIAAGIAAAARDAGVGRTINLGSGRPRAVLDVAQAIGRMAGRPVSISLRAARPGDVRALCADASLARALLGWAPAVAFEDGLARLLIWYERLGVAPERLLDDERERNWLGAAGVG